MISPTWVDPETENEMSTVKQKLAFEQYLDDALDAWDDNGSSLREGYCSFWVTCPISEISASFKQNSGPRARSPYAMRYWYSKVTKYEGICLRSFTDESGLRHRIEVRLV